LAFPIDFELNLTPGESTSFTKVWVPSNCSMNY